MLNTNPLTISEISARATLSEIQYNAGNVHNHNDVMQALRKRSIQIA